MNTAPAITWPTKFLPGTTDNFVSNETYAASVTASQIWSFLADISKWETYYSNCSQITPPSTGPKLNIPGSRFSFSTFGFPPLACSVEESVAPGGVGKPGRLAWRAWMEDESGKVKEGEDAIDVYHAWIVEDVEGGRVRILTQESQIGVPARQLAEEKPNKMLNGHQEWLDGLVRVAGSSAPDVVRKE
ncbi:GTP-binding protein rho4 [Elsinoe australis]|uniref:GTP-binding protein rho4 n=1 Tax=Elsinoe australis TaxID=40998 RepID=A0A2P7ZY68_9PEZI|nr:GTP-binding protein rho4 [Elsinoe australis]